MTSEALLAAFGLYAGTFAVAAVSAVFPLVSIEVFLVAITLTRGPADAVALVILATLGQLVGKVPIYLVACGIAEVPGRQRRWIDRMRAWSTRLGDRPAWVLAASSVIGVPPFSISSTAAGVLRIRLRTFVVVVALGRAARFAVLVAAAAQ